MSAGKLVCYKAVVSVVTQRSTLQTAAENRRALLSLCVCGLSSRLREERCVTTVKTAVLQTTGEHSR